MPMLSETDLKQTPLYQEHLALRAKMVPFGGWAMPVQYDGIIAEYQATRQAATVFDTSHMGEFFVNGDARAAGLDRLVTQPLLDMSLKTCRYGALLNEKGGVIDDLIVYRLAAEQWMIVVNGGTMEKDAGHFTRGIKPGCFHNRSMEIGKLDIQGPASRDILKTFVRGVEKLDYYAFDELNVLGENVLVSRTGYTGELGYEIYFSWERTTELWQELLRRGVKPAGLGARDLLRIEMGYSLYGHELEEDISPLEAGLNKFIDWDKDFIGKTALLAQKDAGVRRKIVCFRAQTRRSPRAGHAIYAPPGQPADAPIGTVTSGTFSPSLNSGIGLGFVPPAQAKPGSDILIGDDKNKFAAQVVSRPVYKNGSLKN